MQGRKVKHLQSLQRPFLLNITRAFRTSPTNALTVLAGLLPLHISVEKEAVYQSIRQLGQVVQYCEETFTADEIEQSLNRLDTHPAQHGAGVHVNFRQNLRSAKAAYTYYTDGSKIDERVGCAYVAFQGDNIVNLWKGHLTAQNSVCQSEATAISNAIQDIIHRERPCSRVITDSQSTLHAVLNPAHSSPIIEGIQENLRRNQEMRITLEWTRAHVGNSGNETADRLAKEAAQNMEAAQIEIPQPVSYLKRKLRDAAHLLWQTAWDNADTGRRAHALLPKVDSEFIMTRPQMVYYITGHGPFPAYFARFGISNSEQCSCGELGTAEHYLYQCPLTEGMHFPYFPYPQNNEQAFRRFLIKHNYHSKAIVKIIKKLMDMGTEICQV
ncbi:uncharacterized protein LOC118194337 [Stegodyphus dumicola]|uniref:uncharacterized protein LOC118194337 n=1 Tax=Stegodyphus dumicola TaxID=202533 RepID=UPI0015B2B9D9|nr:uncharacterized protein LOC118194337 [Stegodyphus dumicola]